MHMDELTHVSARDPCTNRCTTPSRIPTTPCMSIHGFMYTPLHGGYCLEFAVLGWSIPRDRQFDTACVFIFLRTPCSTSVGKHKTQFNCCQRGGAFFVPCLQCSVAFAWKSLIQVCNQLGRLCQCRSVLLLCRGSPALRRP